MSLTYFAVVHPETGAAHVRGSRDDYGYKFAVVSADGKRASFSKDRDAAAWAGRHMPDARVAPVRIVDAKAYYFVKTHGRLPEDAPAAAAAWKQGIEWAAQAPEPFAFTPAEIQAAAEGPKPGPEWAAQADETPIAAAPVVTGGGARLSFAVPPTSEVYGAFQQAFDWFNRRLFMDLLPPCLVTLQRKDERTVGYFWAERFVSADGAKVDEIAMNPRHFGRSLPETLSTLVHEMVHLWQHHYGERKSRKGYHNEEWAREMDVMGLPPCASDGSGKRTGQAMTHTIAPGGRFDVACGELLGDGTFALRWREVADAIAGGKDKKKPTRAKFVCPTCDAKAWAKPSALLICGECDQQMRCDDPDAADGED
jgi:hypothetical protein